jgi:hypothetical protein
MAKITLDTITSSYAATSLFQTNFTAIEDELNDKVLYRVNPTGEANQMENDLDMNSNDILNVSTTYTDMLNLGGTLVTIGDSVIQNTFTETEFTNSATIDTFAVVYTIGFIVVTLNGVELAAADFTATNGTSVVLAAPLVSNNDILKVRAFGTFAVADALAKSENLADVQSASISRTNLDVYSTSEVYTRSETKALLPNRNLIINGDLSVNQRVVTGTVVLSAGVYGHDRFKAGASGCTYTFATSAGVTTLTITAGSLQQVIEATSLPATDVILSWTGTAQGKIDAGSYGASGTVTDTTTGGTNVTVEFNTGTLAQVQLESGDTVTQFEYVSPADQLAKCQRYFERIQDLQYAGTGHAEASNSAHLYTKFSVVKRDAPTVTYPGTVSQYVMAIAGSNVTATSMSAANVGTSSCNSISVTSGLTAGAAVGLFLNTGAYIDIDAEL